MALEDPRPIEALAAVRAVVHRFIFLPGLSVLPGASFTLGRVDRRLALRIRDQVKCLRERLRFAACVRRCDLLIHRRRGRGEPSRRILAGLRRFRGLILAGGGPRRRVINERYRGRPPRRIVRRLTAVDRRPGAPFLTDIRKITAGRARSVVADERRAAVDLVEAVASHDRKPGARPDIARLRRRVFRAILPLEIRGWRQPRQFGLCEGSIDFISLEIIRI